MPPALSSFGSRLRAEQREHNAARIIQAAERRRQERRRTHRLRLRPTIEPAGSAAKVAAAALLVPEGQEIEKRHVSGQLYAVGGVRSEQQRLAATGAALLEMEEEMAVVEARRQQRRAYRASLEAQSVSQPLPAARG